MEMVTPILEFTSVTTSPDPWFDMPLLETTFAIKPGELGLIRFDHHSPRLPIADAAMGLAGLQTGDVHFLGQPWTTFSPREAAQNRGQIGRLFGVHGWVYHLDVDENMTLRLRHHTKRTLADIDREVIELSEVFGLHGDVPRSRPSNIDSRDLQRAACVRMLLGSPLLIVIDEPPSGFFSDILRVLVRQVEAARERGAAILWLSADAAVWTDDTLRPTFRGDAFEPGLGLMPATAAAAEPQLE